MFELLSSVGRCGLTIQRGICGIRGKICEAGWGSGRSGSGVSGGVSGDEYCDTG